MNPNRVDFLVDLAYGVVILLSVVFILTIGTSVGVAFGIGVLVSYVIHVVWKMARFDPEWMTREVTEKVEETLTEEVTESVEQTVTEEVTEEVTEQVEQTVTEEVTENVERTITDEMNDVIDQLEQVNQRVDRRPRTDEIDEMQQELTTEGDGDDADAEEEKR